MKRLWLLILIGCVGVGCSDSGDPIEPVADKTGGHVWQAQENAYRKAQDVAPMLEKADQRERHLMEQQGG
jgi:hypothetical protein